MFRYVLLFIIACFCKLYADVSEVPNANHLKTISSPLYGENNFIIYYVFEDKGLEASLKEIMVASLKKIGTVYSADDSKLTEKEKEDRSKKGSMIQIVITSLIEESTKDSSKYTKLPVMELSLKILSGVEVLKNGSKQGCVIWEKEKFLGNISDEFNEKAIKTFTQIMNDFVEDFRNANPGQKLSQTQFFLYS